MAIDCHLSPCVTLDLSALAAGDILLTAREKIRSPVVPVQSLLLPSDAAGDARWAHAAIFDGQAFWDITPTDPVDQRTLSHFADVNEFHVRRLIDTTIDAMDLKQYLVRNRGATYTTFVSAGMLAKVSSRFYQRQLPPLEQCEPACGDFVCSELVMRALRASALTNGAILPHLAFPFPCDYARELSFQSVRIAWLPIAACNNERRT